MYTPGPSEAELEAIGITLEDVADNTLIDIWPENEVPLAVFASVGTQWFVGPGGPTGLRYEVLPEVFSLLDVPRKKRKEVFECLRIMESEVLKCMNAEKKD